MRVVVGLGNPGKEYEGTRHNIGFTIVRYMVDKYRLSWSKKFKGEVAQTVINGEKIVFLLPMTYMNLSGESVQEILTFYKIDPQSEILVIYDDMDLPIKKLRFRVKGSAGGHNGIKSIIQHCGENFYRLKVGIGKSEHGNTVGYVLGKFTQEEEKSLWSQREVIEKFIESYASGATAEQLQRKVGGV